MSLYRDWLNAKEDERHAIEKRRRIEDELLKANDLPEVYQGTKSFSDSGYKVKVNYRLNTRIDIDLLHEVAAENGLTSHLGELFRWKPEINKKAWDACAPEITQTLEEAITTNLGRPSFSIEPIED